MHDEIDHRGVKRAIGTIERLSRSWMARLVLACRPHVRDEVVVEQSIVKQRRPQRGERVLALQPQHRLRARGPNRLEHNDHKSDEGAHHGAEHGHQGGERAEGVAVEEDG